MGKCAIRRSAGWRSIAIVAGAASGAAAAFACTSHDAADDVIASDASASDANVDAGADAAPAPSACELEGDRCLSNSEVLPSGSGPASCEDFYQFDVSFACEPGSHCCESPKPSCIDGGPLDFTTADLEHDLGDVPYRAPHLRETACEGQSYGSVYTNLSLIGQDAGDGGAMTWDQLTNGLSPPCAACLESSVMEPTWSPLVALQDPTRGFINNGACFAVVDDSTDCGHAAQLALQCASRACAQCDAFGCTSWALNHEGPCFPYVQSARALCPRFDEANATCADGLYGLFVYLCGSP